MLQPSNCKGKINNIHIIPKLWLPVEEGARSFNLLSGGYFLSIFGNGICTEIWSLVSPLGKDIMHTDGSAFTTT